MKGKILASNGNVVKDIDLPGWFSKKIREDICQRCFETSKKIQPYGVSPLAGKLYSASGKLKHRRHKWKTTYGHGISRVPRKIMWRRGTQFHWIGATVSGTRGGRQAHGPKPEHFEKEKKVNKKERIIAMMSGLISTSKEAIVKGRYAGLKDKKVEINLPIIIEEKFLKLKTKDFIKGLKAVLKDAFDVAIKKKIKRAGKGKRRKGQWKTSAGLLLILGSKEEKKITGIDVKKTEELEIKDLYPLGRLTIFTPQAIEELKKLGVKNA